MCRGGKGERGGGEDVKRFSDQNLISLSSDQWVL